MVSTRLQSTTGGEAGPEGGAARTVRHNAPSQELAVYTGGSQSMQPYTSTTHMLNLPSECLEKIFSYLGFKQVSHLRLVCKQMDRVCSAILNSTFQKLQTQMLHRFHGIKSKMPRRESARRNHPLACESDIVETLHMRLTLLQMSFGKHIERKHVCFFAGEILDEVYRILHYIKVTPKLARPYKVTDELFDLSTMAMEYFKEHIEPTLPEIAYFGTDFLDFNDNNIECNITTTPQPDAMRRVNTYAEITAARIELTMSTLACSFDEGSSMHSNSEASITPYSNTISGFKASSSNKYLSLDSPSHKGDESPAQSDLPQQCNMVLRKRIRKIKQGMKRYNYQLSQVRKELRCCRSKVADQQKQIVEYAARLDEYDKKTEETNRKFSTMLQELNKCKTELQYWRSKSPLTSVCNGCGQVVAQLSDHSHPDLQAQAVLLPELPVEPIAGTSADEAMWSHSVGSPGGGVSIEQRNKRKSSTAEKLVASGSGGPPNKKQRNVFKPRNKRL